MSNESASRNCLPCPFCGKGADLDDPDSLHPSGTGWRFDEALQMRTYHNFREVPKEQWCWQMNCLTTAGGCSAEVHGDSKDEAIAAWNRRAPQSERGTLDAQQAALYRRIRLKAWLDSCVDDLVVNTKQAKESEFNAGYDLMIETEYPDASGERPDLPKEKI